MASESEAGRVTNNQGWKRFDVSNVLPRCFWICRWMGVWIMEWFDIISYASNNNWVGGRGRSRWWSDIVLHCRRKIIIAQSVRFRARSIVASSLRRSLPFAAIRMFPSSISGTPWIWAIWSGRSLLRLNYYGRWITLRSRDGCALNGSIELHPILVLHQLQHVESLYQVWIYWTCVLHKRVILKHIETCTVLKSICIKNTQHRK